MLISKLMNCGLLLFCIATLGFPVSYANVSGSYAIRDLTPRSRFVKISNGFVAWSGVVEGQVDVADKYKVLLRRLGKVRSGVPIKVSVGGGAPNGLPTVANEALTRKEGYVINATTNDIYITAHDSMGVARALVRLNSVEKSAHEKRIPIGVWVDWPQFGIRALHLALVHGISAQGLRRTVNIASRADFNALIVLVTPAGVGLSAFGRLSSDPSITQTEFEKFIEYAHESGLSVIPALKLLTHQEKLLGNKYPELMYNKYTYNPDKAEVYKIAFPIIDQLIKLTGANKFLIGHDELAGWKSDNLPEVLTLEKSQNPLPASLFLKDVEIVDRHLEGKGVATLMWGDMLLRPTKGENTQVALYRHGLLPGYGESLLRRLPKNIILCDWQYTGNSFGSMGTFSSSGFKVLGATFKNKSTIKKFSRYAAEHKALGMIQTTWFYLPRGNWIEIYKLAKTSGQEFWNPSS